MTELTKEQQDLLNSFYLDVKDSIKEKKVEYDPITFKPFVKIVMEIDLEFTHHSFSHIPKEKLYEVVGKLICGIESNELL